MVILQLDRQPYIIQAIFSGELDEVRAALETKSEVNILDSEKRSPLHAASFKGDAEITALLLLHGAHVNTKDNKWITPLHRACCCGSSDVVSLLLEHSADITARDKYWQTPLHVAAANNALDCVVQLLEHVPNPNVTDRSGRTALHHASVNGHNDVVEFLLSKGCIVNACDKKDCRPLHYAAHMGHLETVDILLRHGADINSKDRNQYSPLHVSAASGMVSACIILLQAGAEVDIRNAYGNTPLHIACLNGHLPVCDVLLSYKADIEAVNYRGQTPLHIAAASTHGKECLDFLIVHKVNINKQSLDGRSPLHMTAIHGRFTRSKTLIDNGAIVDCIDKNGCTPLHIAAQYGHDLLSNTLLTYGADPAKKGYAGRTPLHMSCLSGHVECSRKFLQAGVDLNAQDDSGKTPIHCAAYKGSVECLDLLVSNCANFHILDKFGRTALHYAAARGHYPCIFTLVGLKSNVNLCDIEGCSPLHLASAYDLKGECVEYLIRHKADPQLKDKKGFTPIHYAVSGENLVGLGFLLTAVGNNYIMHGSEMPLITPLHLAANNGNIDILRIILTYFHDTNIRTEKGSTALLLAARSGHTHCVHMLLRVGAKVSISDAVFQMNPVHFSARNGHTHCLALLLDNTEDKAVIDLPDSLQRTPLMLAVAGGHTKSALTLLKCSADPNVVDADGHSSLFRAVVNGHHGTVQLLISHGAVVKKPDVHGKTVLHLAAASGHLSSLHTILKNMDPSDVLALDNQECSALHWACYNGNSNCVSFILDKEIFKELLGNVFSPVHCATFVGAEHCVDLICNYFGTESVKLNDARNRTPLHIAALHGHVECAKYLLEKGAEIECKDSDGRTPLIAAAQNGQTQILELLISYKADMMSYDNNGNTALHLACLKCHSQAALLLLENIQDAEIVNMINNDRKTALHLSARNGLVNVTRQLISKGSSVLAVDANGMTPALCCAPNNSVAQCLALILANYAICSQQSNSQDNSSFSLCPYPQNICLLFKHNLSEKIKTFSQKISQTDLSLLREPDYMNLYQVSKKHHSNSSNIRKRLQETKSKPTTSSEQILKKNFINSNSRYLWKSSIGVVSNDCSIFESFRSNDQTQQQKDPGPSGLNVHRSYSDMSIVNKSLDPETLRLSGLDLKAKKNVKTIASKTGSCNTKLLKSCTGVENKSGQHDIQNIKKKNKEMNINTSEKLFKDIIHQLAFTYGANISMDQMLHFLTQVVGKLKLSSSTVLKEQNIKISESVACSSKKTNGREVNQLISNTVSKIQEQQINSIVANYQSALDKNIKRNESAKKKSECSSSKGGKTIAKKFNKQAINKNPGYSIRLQEKNVINTQLPESSINKVEVTSEEEKKDIIDIFNRSSSTTNSVSEIHQDNLPPEVEQLTKLKVINLDDEIVWDMDKILKEKQVLKEDDLEKLHEFQKRMFMYRASFSEMFLQSQEKPEYIVMEGLKIIKASRDLSCIAPYMQILNLLLAKWPSYMSQTAEIMKHIIATIQEHEWLDKFKDELPKLKCERTLLEESEEIQKTAQQVLKEIGKLQKEETVKDQFQEENNIVEVVAVNNDFEKDFTNKVAKQEIHSARDMIYDSDEGFNVLQLAPTLELEGQFTKSIDESLCYGDLNTKTKHLTVFNMQVVEIASNPSLISICVQTTSDDNYVNDNKNQQLSNFMHGIQKEFNNSVMMSAKQSQDDSEVKQISSKNAAIDVKEELIDNEVQEKLSVLKNRSDEPEIIDKEGQEDLSVLKNRSDEPEIIDKEGQEDSSVLKNRSDEPEIIDKAGQEDLSVLKNRSDEPEIIDKEAQEDLSVLKNGFDEPEIIDKEAQEHVSVPTNKFEQEETRDSIKETYHGDVVMGTISLVSFLSVQEEMRTTIDKLSSSILKLEDKNETTINKDENPISIEALYINRTGEQDSILEESVFLDQIDNEKGDETETANFMFEETFNECQEINKTTARKESFRSVAKKKYKTKDGLHCVIS